ncbi:hypothetical protein ACVXG7_09270 [Enterobacter hormaechei]
MSVYPGLYDCWGLIMDDAIQGVTLNDFRVDYPWWKASTRIPLF